MVPRVPHQCIFDLHAVFGMEDGSTQFWDSEELQQRWWRCGRKSPGVSKSTLRCWPMSRATSRLPPGPIVTAAGTSWPNASPRPFVRSIAIKPIIIDCLNGCHPGGFGGLEPTGDANTWYSFHFYEPHAFHCQKRLWLADQGTYHYPGEFGGKWWNRADARAAMAGGTRLRRQAPCPLVRRRVRLRPRGARMEDAVWLLDMVSLLDTRNIGWTYYHFMSHAIHPHWQETFRLRTVHL